MNEAPPRRSATRAQTRQEELKCGGDRLLALVRYVEHEVEYSWGHLKSERPSPFWDGIIASKEALRRYREQARAYDSLAREECAETGRKEVYGAACLYYQDRQMPMLQDVNEEPIPDYKHMDEMGWSPEVTIGEKLDELEQEIQCMRMSAFAKDRFTKVYEERRSACVVGELISNALQQVETQPIVLDAYLDKLANATQRSGENEQSGKETLSALIREIRSSLISFAVTSSLTLLL